MSRFRKTAIVVGIMAVAAAAPLAAFAHNNGNPRPLPAWAGPDGVAYGSVTATATGSFTLTTPGGTAYSVATTAKTRFVAVNPSDGATFQTGDAVLTRGVFLNGLTARVVWYDSAPFAMRGSGEGFSGTGVSNSSTQLVITDTNTNTDTFTLSSNTKFRVNGRRTAAGSVPNVSGDKVNVWAVANTDGSWAAGSVGIWLPKK